MKLALQSEMAITNDDVRQLDRSYVFHSWSMQGSLNPLVIAGAKGCELWDYDGNTYLDFSSQLVNVNIGYQHPRVLAAMKAQLEELTTIAPATANLARGEAAKRIVDLAPKALAKCSLLTPVLTPTRTPCVWRVCTPDATRFFCLPFLPREYR
jgi:taurine--2-oxoglutarate transaminase